MHAQLFDQLHPDWKNLLQGQRMEMDVIQDQLQGLEFTPPFHHILRALSKPIESTKVVIFGQDPYPSRGHAHGYSFSVDSSVSPLPPSLRNIFEELESDLGGVRRLSGDLSDWADQGVMLINRILTTNVGESMAHKDLQWQVITRQVAIELGKRDVVAILWGSFAGELSQYFRKDWVIHSAHPSPLSSYRGFFGSKPFSRSNEILERNDLKGISW